MARIFQREMEKRLSHVPFTVLRMYNILISEKNDNEDFQNLDSVIGIVIKCGFMACEVTDSVSQINKKEVNRFLKK